MVVAVLGRERRRYDLNQGTYRFDVTASREIGPTEIAVLVSHVSRHLADREHFPAISWNILGVRASQRFEAGRSVVEARLDVGRAMQQASVDYVWMSEAHVRMRRPVTDRVELLAAASGARLGVTRAIAGRAGPCGGRLEVGLRVNGRAAALEVFAGYERRIDAFPTDRARVRFFTAGFRLVSG